MFVKDYSLRYVFSFVLIASTLSFKAMASSSWDGSIELEHRYFFDSDASQSFNVARSQSSAKLEMEFYRDWNDGDDTLVFEPFLRADSRDSERTHGDIRQLIWSRLADNWELSAGLGRVFWGVTESQHLVDIVNQTDAVENIDGEDKLGQPMIRYQYFHRLGNIDAYVLPRFRERTFAGIDSRINGGLVVDSQNAEYESSREEKHVDFALRYNNTFGALDVGLSLFDGTSREPDLLRLVDPLSLFTRGPITTTAYYPQITQFGADIQLTTDVWLIKLEAINRDFDDDIYKDFSAATAGVEYTFTGVFGSVYDLGVLAEYSWDERGEQASAPFQNDVFFGARLAFNNMSSSEMLAGIIRDMDDSNTYSIFLETSTRIGNAITANIELRYLNTDNPQDLLFGLRDDSFIQIGLQYFFD